MSLPNMQNNIIPTQNMLVNMNHQIITQNNGVVNSAMSHQNHQMMEQNNLEQSQHSQLANTPLQNISQKQIQNAHGQNASDTMQVLTKQRLQDLVRETDQTLNLEEEVEEIILGYVDEFVDRCLNGAALIAKNRHGNTSGKTIEVRDIQQFLNRNYNMWTPGFGTDELKPYKRSLTTEAHKQRMALIRKTLKKY